ncbi:MAG: signal peptidase II [Myxococcota bacterium]|nr:signal peptidase II [Myxococcota bacterium]
MSLKTKIFTTVSVVFLILDQITKVWIQKTLCLQTNRPTDFCACSKRSLCDLPPSIDVVDGLLQIVHVENTGAAFGMLNTFEYAMHLFLFFTVFAVGMLIQCLRELEPGDRFLSTTLGLILAGALGNGIDRVDKQAVTDFIRFYLPREHPGGTWLIQTFGTNEYPSFNVADMCIVVGVGLFVVHYMFLEDREEDLDDSVDPNSASGNS